jgi:hypothetical protein
MRAGRNIMPEVTINPELLEIVKSLELSDDMNISLAKLLEKEIQRALAVYEHMAENFRTQYGMTFEEFAHSALMQEPSFGMEQDYFDWEMATTLIQDLREKLVHIYKVLRK